MRFNDFLNRIGLDNDFAVLSDIPLNVFFKGVKQSSFPYEKMNLDTTCFKDLTDLLSNAKHHPAINKLRVEIHMTGSVINLMLLIGIKVEYQIILWYSH